MLKNIYRFLFALLFIFSQTAQSMEEEESHYSDEYPLHQAANAGDTKKVIELIKEGADPNQKTDEDGDTPLIAAAGAEKNSYEVTKYLLDNVDDIDINALNDIEVSALHFTILGDIDTAQLLIERGADPNIQNKYGNSPLELAVTTKQPEFVEMLLKNRAALNIYDINGNTPLHYAVAGDRPVGSGPLTIPAPVDEYEPTEDESEIIKLLLNYEAPIGYKNVDFQTPLHLAAGWNNLVALELLVDHLKATNNLAPLNYQDRIITEGGARGGNTALHYAVLNRNLPMVQMLIAAGADINKQNSEGNTPLNLVLSVLPEELTDADQKIAELLIDKEASLQPNNVGDSPIISIFRFLDGDYILKVLNRQDMAVSIQDPHEGEMPLHALAARQDLQEADLSAIISSLLAKGADINAQANNGATPLQYAVGYNNPKYVLQLLFAGADPEETGGIGKTPLELSEDEGNDEITKILKEFPPPEFIGIFG